MQRNSHRHGVRRGWLVLGVSLMVVACTGTATPTVPPSADALATPEAQAHALPTGEEWLTHFRQDLLPFWDQPSALGEPLGDFPSVRCDDGSLVDYDNPCPEIARNAWLMNERRQFTVSVSRQIYGYGVAFHLTGDPRYLTYMKAGVDYFRETMLDRLNGGAYAFHDGSVGGPAPNDRNPQELGYAQLGMSFYYYLTRDEEVLADILALRTYIFDTYYDADQNYLTWQPLRVRDGGRDPNALRLVAQLDQLNSHLVLLAPMIPAPEREAWEASMITTAQLMIDNFYHPQANLFATEIDDPFWRGRETVDTDFGHSAKALWMIRFVGLLTGEADMVTFSEAHAPALLEAAYLPETGSWARAVEGGEIDADKEWWVYAELDQLSATMAMSDEAYVRYLPAAYGYYFTYLVDPDDGEVWTSVEADTNQPATDLPKQWPWKNAYHSFEHALVGYISAQSLADEPITLYYAFGAAPDMASVRPYLFTGEVVSSDTADVDGVPVYTVVFEGVR